MMLQRYSGAPSACARKRSVSPKHALAAHKVQRNRIYVCRTSNGVTADPKTTDVTTTDATDGSAHLPARASTGFESLPPAAQQEARELVDKVLAAVKDTDSGIAATPEQRSAIDSMLDRLEALGAQQQPRPLQDPLLWGNYNVAYTSIGRSREQGEPAGGRFRGRIGRALFQTKGLFQSVLKPDIATNKVEFKLFGFIPGHVGLRGQVLPYGDPQRADTVQVLFEPTTLTIANSLHLRIGRPSSVVLSTTYLDERVRLGKGSKGSLFVFTRGGAAEQAGMDKVGLERTSLTAAAVFSAFFVSLFLGGALAWMGGHPALRALALGLWMLGAAIGGIVRQGGVILTREDKKLVEEAQANAQKARAERESQQQQGSAGGGAAPAAA